MSILTLEKSVERVDVLVALGKNIGVGFSHEDVRADPFHLSPESRMIADAAGLLYVPGMKLLFSTGKTTTGPGIPSEARAMYNYARIQCPHIDPQDVLLEERSLNTAENAEEVAKELQTHKLQAQTIGLLTVGYHSMAAAMLFRTKGVNVRQHFAAEDVLRNHSPQHSTQIDAWENSPRIRRERQKELFRVFLLFTVDPEGKLLSGITHQTRG